MVSLLDDELAKAIGKLAFTHRRGEPNGGSIAQIDSLPQGLPICKTCHSVHCWHGVPVQLNSNCSCHGPDLALTFCLSKECMLLLCSCAQAFVMYCVFEVSHPDTMLICRDRAA